MAKVDLVLDATPRVVFGKNAMRKLRATGELPAVIYGQGEPLSVQVSARLANKVIHQAHGQIIKVRLQDGKKTADKACLLKEVQATPVGARLLHLDFQEVSADRPVRVSVEIHPVGTPVGVTFGGIMQVMMHAITVECLPKDIPAFIEVDVTDLKIGHSLHVKEITYPKGVKPVTDGQTAVVVITGRTKEEEETPAAAAAAGEGAAAPVAGSTAS